MKYKLFASLTVILICFQNASAQTAWEGHTDNFCQFDNLSSQPETLYTYPANDEFNGIVGRIVYDIGLSPNFQVLQANVDNAAAITHEGARYILYSADFMSGLQNNSNEWSRWVILAHEVGHHLNGHALDDLGSRPLRELEADKFSGAAIKRMGGTLEEGLAIYRKMSDYSSTTHPGKKARIEAFINGYNSVRTDLTKPTIRQLPAGDRIGNYIIAPNGKIFEGQTGEQLGYHNSHGDVFDNDGSLRVRGALSAYLLEKSRDRLALDIVQGMGERRVKERPFNPQWVNEGYCQNGVCYRKATPKN